MQNIAMIVPSVGIITIADWDTLCARPMFASARDAVGSWTVHAIINFGVVMAAAATAG